MRQTFHSNCKRSQFPSSGETQNIPAGTHDYSFTCTVPPNVPEEFSGTYGYIRYAANVALRIPFWPDKKFQRAFHVYKRLDLNENPLLRVIFEYAKSGTRLIRISFTRLK